MQENKIILRDFCNNDIDSIAEYANNVNVVKYMSHRIPHPYSRDDAKWWVKTGCKELGINKAIDLNGECIGVVGIYLGEYERALSAEIGYWIGEKFWGHGFTTQAVAHMTHYVFNNLDIIRLTAPVYHPNKASMRVLEKNGYSLEAVHHKAISKHSEIYDEYLFVKLRQ